MSLRILRLLTLALWSAAAIPALGQAVPQLSPGETEPAVDDAVFGSGTRVSPLRKGRLQSV